MEEHVDDKGSLSVSGSDHEAMESWTFVDESRSSEQQQQQPESSKSADCQPQRTETKTSKYHLSVDQDNDTELSDGISIISDSDCGGRHTPEPQSEAEKELHAPPTPPDTPLSLVAEKRLAEVDNRLAEKEPDVVRGVFGIGRRHVMMVVLLAGISGAMFGHIFRAMPGPPCDCSKLLEPLMNRVYDLEVENFRLRDEVTKLTQKILPKTPPPSSEKSQEPVFKDSMVQEDKVWAGDRDEAIVKPLVDESICGGDTGDDLLDDYYGKMCREAEERVKEARKGFEGVAGDLKSSWSEEPPRPPPRREPERPKPRPEPVREERKPEKERKSDDRKGKPGKYQDRDDRKNSKEDRRNSKEKFDERRKRDDDWSGEEYRKRERNEKMKKGERKNYDDFKDSRERKNGDKKRDKRNGKKWRDDDNDSREDRSKEVDAEWHNKRMKGREQFREKESGEKNANWYLERGSDREIKRLRMDESHESHERRR